MDSTTIRGTTVRTVPFNMPYLTGIEATRVQEAISSRVLDGDGPFTEHVQHLLSGMTGAHKAFLTPSCTHALELMALLLDLEPGDEVIMPSFTFPSTATAFALRGAVPVFVDCRADTFNIDEDLIEECVTRRTRAIVVVHYAGVACEMDRIQRIADRYGLPVLEDNAHGLTGAYKGRPLGSLGVLAAQSFHSTKNIHCGEGGALLVNDPAHVPRAEVLRDKGTNRAQYRRGDVDRYRWHDLGSSLLPSDLLAAFLTAQLESADDIQNRMHAVWSAYRAEITGWASEQGVRTQSVPAECAHTAHIFALVLPSVRARDRFLAHLSARGVHAAIHYQSLHDSPAGLRYGRCGPSGAPVTERLAEQLVRLPISAAMSAEDVRHVITSVTSFRCP